MKYLFKYDNWTETYLDEIEDNDWVKDSTNEDGDFDEWKDRD